MDTKSEINLNNSASFSNSELDVEIKRDCSFNDNNEAINDFKMVLTEEVLIKDDVEFNNIDENPIVTISNVAVNLCEPPIDVKQIKEEVDEIIHSEEVDSNNDELKSEQLVKVEPEDEEKLFECIFCKTQFADKNGMMQHLRGKARCHRYECPTCKHKFSEKVMLINHIKRCISCKICQKPFRDKYRLSKHMIIHTKIKKYFDCDICQKEYKGHVNLKLLIELHNSHAVKIDPIVQRRQILFKCEFCSKTYSKKHDMKRHMKSHTQVVEYECNICQIRFPSIYLIKSHMTCHSENKPLIFNTFLCKICHKSFATKANLNRHAAIHDDKRPLFECNVCKKKYVNLVLHMEIHNSTRKIIECNICKGTFYEKSALIKHIRRYHT